MVSSRRRRKMKRRRKETQQAIGSTPVGFGFPEATLHPVCNIGWNDREKKARRKPEGSRVSRVPYLPVIKMITIRIRPTGTQAAEAQSTWSCWFNRSGDTMYTWMDHVVVCTTPLPSTPLRPPPCMCVCAHNTRARQSPNLSTNDASVIS